MSKFGNRGLDVDADAIARAKNVTCMASYFTNCEGVSALASITYYCSVDNGSVDPVNTY